MNLDNLNKWITLAANIGVLVTIGFLAVQISQSNRIAVASSEMAIRNSFGQLNEAVYADDALAKLFTETTSTTAEFDSVEFTKLQAVTTQVLNTWISIEIANQNGMAADETYQQMFDDIRRFIEGRPALRPILRGLVELYPALSSSETMLLIDSLLNSYEL